MVEFIVSFAIGFGWAIIGTVLGKRIYEFFHYHSYTETRKRKDAAINKHLRNREVFNDYLRDGYSRHSTVTEKVKEIMELQNEPGAHRFITTEEIEEMRNRVLGRGQKVSDKPEKESMRWKPKDF